jgi:hypothetical protein
LESALYHPLHFSVKIAGIHGVSEGIRSQQDLPASIV